MSRVRARARAAARPQRGFTLVEVAFVIALAAVLLLLALPAWQTQLVRGRRTDAVAALRRVQFAQESHRAAHGLYAAEFAALARASASRSEAGYYELRLERSEPERYRASAIPLAGGAQASDRECAPLTLDVERGVANLGPDPRCWSR
jgi:type IV pilus assembly protein PilE